MAGGQESASTKDYQVINDRAALLGLTGRRETMPRRMTRGESEQVGGRMQGRRRDSSRVVVGVICGCRIGSALHTYSELRSIHIMPKMANARRQGEIIRMEYRLAREANGELTDGRGDGQEGLRAYMCRRMNARFAVPMAAVPDFQKPLPCLLVW